MSVRDDLPWGAAKIVEWLPSPRIGWTLKTGSCNAWTMQDLRECCMRLHQNNRELLPLSNRGNAYQHMMDSLVAYTTPDDAPSYSLPTVMLCERFRQLDSPTVESQIAEHELTLDKNVWSLGSTIFNPPDLSGLVSERTTMEAMVIHSDNTVTDMVLKQTGADAVRRVHRVNRAEENDDP